MSRTRTALALVATSLALAVTLAGCGSTTSSTSSTSAAPTTAGAAVTASDGWVKTAPSGMTAAFVTLTNPSDVGQVVVSASSPASAVVQIHEMVMQDGQLVMQQKKDGIPVPAHGTVVLEPGGNHLMLMDVTEPIKPGDVVPFTLTFASGATLAFSATAKDFMGAQESYQPSSGASPSSTK